MPELVIENCASGGRNRVSLGGANPPIEDLLEGYEVLDMYGSGLDGDYRGCVWLLRRTNGI